MDYGRIYSALVERARGRSLDGYVERHHVLPKCMGGGDERANIVRLTAEEHFVAHQLLVKMHPGHIGLLWALSAMCNGSSRLQRTNKRYGWLRRKFSKALSERYKGQAPSEACRAAALNVHLGSKREPYTAEHRAAISAAKKGKQFSAEHRANLASAKLGKKLAPRSAATRKRMSEAQRRAAEWRDLSFTQTDAYRAAHSARMKQWWAERKLAREV